jgi:YD repeat-containing protein
VLIRTWRTTRENSATTRVEWDGHSQLIGEARERLPYPKGQAGSGSL